MRASDPGNWWDGLEELNDDGTRRDDRLWEPTPTDQEVYDYRQYEQRLFDGAEGEPP